MHNVFPVSNLARHGCISRQSTACISSRTNREFLCAQFVSARDRYSHAASLE